MRAKTTIVAVAVAATASLVVVGANSFAASARTTSHTLKFTSVQTAEKDFAGNRFVDSDKDVAKGKVIGYDVINGKFNAKTGKFTIDFAGSLSGGIIYGHGTGSAKASTFGGKVTGGTGKFKGVTGTITGKSTGNQGQNEQLVIVYHS